MSSVPGSGPRPSATTYSITQLVEVSGLPAHTLRWYERVGLLDDVPRDASGRRFYGAQHVVQLQLVTALRESGMSVAELQDYLRQARERRSVACRRTLERHQQRLHERIASLQSSLDQLSQLTLSWVEPDDASCRPRS